MTQQACDGELSMEVELEVQAEADFQGTFGLEDRVSFDSTQTTTYLHVLIKKSG